MAELRGYLKAAHSKDERKLHLRTAVQLYNELADVRSCIIIVDVRGADSVAESTIDGARHFPVDDFLPSSQLCDCPLNFKRALGFVTPNIPNPSTMAQAMFDEFDANMQWTVVLCCEAPSIGATEALLTAAKKSEHGSGNEHPRHHELQSQRLSVPWWARALLPDKRALLAANAFGQLANVESVAYLCGGFQAFRDAYPFMCTGSSAYEAGRLYPSQITRALPEPAPAPPHETGKRFVIEEEVGFGGPVYLSSHALAFDPVVLAACGITHVINVTPDHPNADVPDGAIHFLRIPVVDSCDQDIASHFPRACAFIDRALSTMGSAVLVHCRHGQSRSATVVAAWLMSHDASMSSSSALSYLRECRPRVRPNESFRASLEAAEQDRAMLGLDD